MSSYQKPNTRRNLNIFNPYDFNINSSSSNVNLVQLDQRFVKLKTYQTITGQKNFIEPIELTTDNVSTEISTSGSNFLVSRSVNLPTGSNYKINNVDLVPSQTGNSGRYLSTNGSTTSWQTVDALPSQSGNSGRYLTTNGSLASWNSIPTSSPGGSNTQIQFNDSGAFNGDSGLTYNKTTDTLTIGGGLIVDTNTLVIDSTNNRLGFNNLTPLYSIDGVGDVFRFLPSSSNTDWIAFTGPQGVSFQGFNSGYSMKIISTNNRVGAIYFSNTTSGNRGNIVYNHSTDTMTIAIAGTDRLTLTSALMTSTIPLSIPSLTISTNLNMNRTPLLTGLTNDPNHGLRQSSNATLWNGVDYNGPVLHGNTSVVLGTKNNALEKVALVVNANNETTTFGKNNLAFATTGRFVEIDANSVNTSYIDFHSLDSGASDYDARIISSGGNSSTSGQATLTIQALISRFPNQVNFGSSPNLTHTVGNDNLNFFNGSFFKWTSINNRPYLAPIRGTIFSGTEFIVPLSGNYNQYSQLLIAIMGGNLNWSFATGINMSPQGTAGNLSITGTIPGIQIVYSNNISNIRFTNLNNLTYQYCIWVFGFYGDVFNN